MAYIYARPPLKSTTKQTTDRRQREDAIEPSRPSWFRDLAFERDVARLHQLGPRAVAELLRDVGAQTMKMTTIESRVADFADLDLNTVHALGGDRFARPPLTVVKSADEEPAT